MKNTLLSFTLIVAVIGLAKISQAASANPVLDDYVAVAGALAKDDLTAAKNSASALADVAKTEKQMTIADQATAIASSDSLDAAREHFKIASVEAEKLAAGKEGYYVLTCSMAKADWVQKSTKVQNPYLGQSMPNCGSLKSGKSGSTPQSMSMSGGCCG